jgi:AcrR family transcriptional regulator
MKNGGVDRRVSRTRVLLHNALLSLLSEKSYETITVEEICERANVGRSTFYAHYTGKDDLKRSGIDDHLRKLLAEHQRESLKRSGEPSDDGFGFSLAMFEHARDHRDLYRALAGGRGGAIALGTIRQVLSDAVREELRSAASRAHWHGRQLDVAVQFVVGGYMAVLTWWLDRGAKLPPDEVDALFRTLATKGVAAGGP